MRELKATLKGLTCAHCAGKIETTLSKLAETEEVSLNLMKQELTLSYHNEITEEQMQQTIEKTVHTYEPEVEVLFGGRKPEGHNSCSCCCDCGGEARGHAQDHPEEETFGKAFFLRFGLGILLFLAAVLRKEDALGMVLFLAAYLVFGYDVLLRAGRNILRGQVFDENFLMSVSTIGALAIGEMAEAVFVMLFYQVGEAFQDYAVARSRKSITALLDIRPDFARLVTDGKRKKSPLNRCRWATASSSKRGNVSLWTASWRKVMPCWIRRR